MSVVYLVWSRVTGEGWSQLNRSWGVKLVMAQRVGTRCRTVGKSAD